MKYILKQVKTSFLGLVDLPDECASTITDALLEFCARLNLDMTRCVGLSSDGASVMVGQQNGVSS